MTGGKVVYDTRVYLNTRDVVLAASAQPIIGKTWNAFMREIMLSEGVLYGGEISDHH